jgi:hypothetical protein
MPSMAQHRLALDCYNFFAASCCGTAFSLIAWCCAQTCLVWGVIWLIQVSIRLAGIVIISSLMR